MSHAHALLLALLIAPAPLATQEAESGTPRPEPSVRVADRVVGADGEPWADATVVLCAHTTPQARELGEHHGVGVTTNQAGIFRASILSGLDYSAWAYKPANDGRWLRTELRHDVVPGALIELVATDPQPALSLKIVAPPDWDELRPFSVLIAHDHPDIPDEWLPPAEDDAFVLPPLPAGEVDLLLLDRHGEPFVYVRRSTGHQFESDRVVVTVPPAVDVPLLVRDAAGRPIAGATVRHQTYHGFRRVEPSDLLMHVERQAWRCCGNTDAEGRLTVRLPLEFDPLGPDERRGSQSVLFVASAEGRMDAHSGYAQGHVFCNGAQVTERVDALHFTLAAAEPWTGSLVAGPGEPLAGVDLLVTATCRMNARDNSWTHLRRRFLATTDAEGRWSVPGMPADAQYLEVACRVPESIRNRWTHDGLAPSRVLHLASLARATELTRDLSTYRPVRVVLRDAEQGPAVGVQLESMDLDRRPGLRPQIPDLHRVDRRGEVLLYRQPGHHGLIAVDERGYAHAPYEVPGTGTDPRPVELELRPWPTFRARVLGPDRLPLTERPTTRDAGGSRRNSRDPFLEQLRAALTPALREFASSADWHDGVLTVRCFPSETATRRLEIRTSGGEKATCELVPTEREPVIIELRKDG